MAFSFAQNIGTWPKTDTLIITPRDVFSLLREQQLPSKRSYLLKTCNRLSIIDKRYVNTYEQYIFIYYWYFYTKFIVIGGNHTKNINYLMSYSENIQVLRRFKKIEDSILIPFLKKKKKLFNSKNDCALHTDHMHYFTKKEVLEFRKNKSSKSVDPRCVVCGLRLTQYRTQIQYQTMELPAYKDGK